MATAISLASEVCDDVPRWYSAAVVLTTANVPLSLGYSCVTDLCIQRLFDEEYTTLVLGTDYTADLDAGTVTLLAALEGTAIAYFNVIVCATEEECKTAPCCPPDPYDYQSINGTDSGTETNEDCIEVEVTVEPVSGSYVFFPTYVVLTAPNDAVIRYTTDGTDPDEFSTLYEAPFVVAESGTVIKARATVGDCAAGAITTVLYQNPPFPIGMVYKCDTPDNGGTWDVWAPNGTVDNHWQIEFTLPGATTIKRLEMYQLDAAGGWTTGIVWSTDSPITIDGVSFDAMPLLLFIAAAQQHTDYQASLGSFGAATHTWDLYGDRQFGVSGFFKLEMVLDDDSRLTSIVDVDCTTDPPIPCESPAAPTATGLCDGFVDVEFTGALGQNYRVYVSEVGAPGGWTVFSADAIGAVPQNVVVGGLTPGGLYYFRVDLEYADCGFQASIPVQAIPLPEPVVSIATDKTIVDPNESFTISWNSDFIGGAVCGGCLDGQVSINQSIGCQAGNVPDQSVQSQAVAGIYTYTIMGCNTCGTVVASVQVEVRDIAVCGEGQPTIITLENPTTFLCGAVSSGCHVPLGGGAIAWNGDMVLDETCRWALVGTNLWGGCETVLGIQFPIIGAGVAFEGGVWVLSIAMFGTYWTGTKATGSTPVGVYTRTSGCMTGPATLTVT